MGKRAFVDKENVWDAPLLMDQACGVRAWEEEPELRPQRADDDDLASDDEPAVEEMNAVGAGEEFVQALCGLYFLGK
jgi:hypothetical protein